MHDIMVYGCANDGVPLLVDGTIGKLMNDETKLKILRRATHVSVTWC